MPNLGNLVVKILGDTKDIKNKLNEYGKKVDGAKKATDNFSSGVKNSFKNLVKLGAIIGGAFLAVRKLTNFIRDNLDAYGQQERAITELNSALEATGKYTPQLSEELQQLASDLQDTTTYGDEATLSAMAMLQSLADLSGEGLKQAIPLVQDLAAGMKIDLETAASLMGKTLGSTTNALSRYGLVLDATASPTEKLAALQEQINEKFGGRAAALAKDYTGSVEQLKNQYGDLKEELGELTAYNMPAYIELSNAIVKNLKNWISKINDLRKAGEKWRESIKNMNIQELEEQIKLDDIRLDDMAEEMRRLDDITATTGKLSKAHRDAKKALEPLNEEWWELVKSNEAARKQMEILKTTQDEIINTKDDDIEKTGKLINLTKTTTEETNALAQSLGYAGNILAGNFAPNITYTNTALDKMAIAMQNLTEPVIIGSGSWENYTWKVEEARNALEELANKYDEWADKADETMGRITGLTSMGVNAINGLQSQLFKNREIELDNWYEKEKDKIYANIEDEEEREKALEELDHEADQRKRKLARDEAKASKSIAIMNAIINTASAITKSLSQGGFIFGPIFAAFIGALGAAQIAAIKAQPLPALATGADFITQGPQLVMVGDNPGGREHVEVTPIGSPNINGPGREIIIHNNLYLDSDQVLEFISKAAENGRLPIHADAIIQ